MINILSIFMSKYLYNPCSGQMTMYAKKCKRLIFPTTNFGVAELLSADQNLPNLRQNINIHPPLY